MNEATSNDATPATGLGYSPGAGAAQDASGGAIKVNEKKYPAGFAGHKLSMVEIAKCIRRGKNDPYIRGWVGKVLQAAGSPEDSMGQATAIVDAVRSKVQWVRDPAGTEMIVAAKYTLCLVPNGLCIPIGDCDDLTVVMGECLAAAGFNVWIVGQAYDPNPQQAEHVLVAFEPHETPGERIKIDPSTKMPVGQAPIATREWWVNPMSVKDETMKADGQTVPVAGDFVGVGAPRPIGFGDTGTPLSGPATAIAVNTVKLAVAALKTTHDNLKAAADQVMRTRQLLRPTNLYDPEPATPIQGIADFPVDGTWTASMSEVVASMLSTMATLVQAGEDAINGKRTIYVNQASADVLIGAKDGDPFHLQAVWSTATDTIIAVYDHGMQLVGGFGRQGTMYDPAAIEQYVAAAAAQGGATGGASGTTGTSGVGLGIPQAIAIVGIIAAALVVSGVITYYIIHDQGEKAKTIAMEVTRQEAIKCVASGKCSQDFVLQLEQESNEARIQYQNAQNAGTIGGQLTSVAGNVGKVVMWLVLGGAAAVGIYYGAPLIKEGVVALEEKLRTKRLAAAKENPMKQDRVREAAWKAIWNQPEYVRLYEHMERTNKALTRADDEVLVMKHSPMLHAKAVKNAERARANFKRAHRKMTKYEDEFVAAYVARHRGAA